MFTNLNEDGMMTLIPAYGRDYKSEKEVLTDFNNNKDFKMVSIFGSAYINKQDLMDIGTKSVNIRFNNKICQTSVDLN